MSPAAVMVAVGLRVAARRPAAWLAFAATIACDVALVAAGGPAAWPVAIVCGALVAIAAAGDPPRGLEAAPAAAVWWSPLAWPLAGAAGLAAVAGTQGCTVAIALAAAALGVTAFRPLLGRVALRWRTAVDHAVMDHAPRAAASPGWVGFDATRTPLATVALATMLLAMAVCFFLDPDRAGWYAIVAAAWFVVLTLPVAAVAGGSGDEAARGRLVRSAAGPPAGSPGTPLPGSLACAIRALATHAALLVWPAVVAALLWGGAADRSDGPLVAIAALAALTVATAAVLALASLCGASGDTSRAAVACTLAIVAALALPQSPVLPSPSRPLAPRGGIQCEVDVEGLQTSCEAT